MLHGEKARPENHASHDKRKKKASRALMTFGRAQPIPVAGN
jgi:hypothetical protein